MKVTVCFGEVRVVVPCRNGKYLVKQLVSDAVARYHKAIAKSSDDNWLTNINSLRLMVADGGILDPDDSVADVIDDKEQLTAIIEEPLGHRHHNNGDGMSGGTSSPVSFHDDVASEIATIGRPDVIVKPADQPTETLQNDSTIDHSVVSGLQQAQLGAGFVNHVRGSRSNNISLVAVSSNVQGMASIIHKDKVPVRDNNLHSINKKPVINDVNNSESEIETIIIEFPKSAQPLGIHVIPEVDESNRNQGLMIQSLEPGGRAQVDGRLRIGDLFTEINGTSLFHVDFNRAQEIFRRAMQDRRLQITVIRRCDSPTTHHTGFSTATESTLLPSTNQHTAIQPLTSQHIAVQPSANQHVSLTSEVGSKHSATASMSSNKSSEDGLSSAETKVKKEAPPVALRSRSQSVPDDRNSRVVSRKQTIQLVRSKNGLGFTVTTRASSDPSRCLVYIKNIIPGGAAIKDGRLKPGDLLLEINGQNMTDKTQAEAVELLRNTPLGGTVQLVICRQLMEKQSSAVQSHSLEARPMSTLGFQEKLTSPSKIVTAQSSDMFPVDSREMIAEDNNENEVHSVDMVEHSSSQVSTEKRSVRSNTSSATSDSRFSSMRSADVARSDELQQQPTTTSRVDQDQSEVSSDTSSGVLEVNDMTTSVKADPNALVLSDDHEDHHATGTMLNSRRSLSMGNLSTLDRKQSMDSEGTIDDFQQGRLKFSRKVNQSFRAAVDKSYDGPSLYSILTEAKWKDVPVDKKKSKKEEGKSGFKWLFGLSRRRSKSVSSKEKSSESKRPEITVVLPPEDADKNTSSTSNDRLKTQLPVSSRQIPELSSPPLNVDTKLTANIASTRDLTKSLDSYSRQIQVQVSDENDARQTTANRSDTTGVRLGMLVPSPRGSNEMLTSVDLNQQVTSRNAHVTVDGDRTRNVVGIEHSHINRRQYVGDVLHARPAVHDDLRSRPPYRQPLEPDLGFERRLSRSGQMVASKQVKSPDIVRPSVERDRRDIEDQLIVRSSDDISRPTFEERLAGVATDYSSPIVNRHLPQPVYRYQFNDRTNDDLSKSRLVTPVNVEIERGKQAVIMQRQDYMTDEAYMRSPRGSEPHQVHGHLSPTNYVHRQRHMPNSQYVSYQKAPAVANVPRQQYKDDRNDWIGEMSPPDSVRRVGLGYPRYVVEANKDLEYGRDSRQPVAYGQPSSARLNKRLPSATYIDSTSSYNTTHGGSRSPEAVHDQVTQQSNYWSRDTTRGGGRGDYSKPVYYGPDVQQRLEPRPLNENTYKEPAFGVNQTNTVVYGPPRLAQKPYEFWNLQQQSSNVVPSPHFGVRTYMS